MAAVAGLAASAPLLARGGMAQTPGFVVLRAQGMQFVELADCADAPDCAVSTVQVQMLGLRPAPTGAALADVRVSSMFDVPGAAQSPVHVLHFSAATPEHATRGARFVASRDAMRGLRIEYRLHDDAPAVCRQAQCAVVAQAFGLLAPGQYVLVGPRRDGGRVDPRSLRVGADVQHPISDEGRDFDYVAFTVHAQDAALA